MDQNLKAYIESERAKGMSDDGIRTILLNLGYERSVVTAAFAEMNAGQPAAPVFHAAPEIPAPAPSSATPLAAQPGEAAPARDRKKLVIRAGIAALLVLLVGAGGAGAYYYFSSPPVLTPDAAMQTMLGKMANVESFTYRVKMRTETTAGATGTENVLGAAADAFTLDATGAVDYPDAFQSTATVGIEGPDLRGSAVFEFRVVDRTAFVQLASMSQLGLAGAFLGPFQGQWISVDLSAASSTASQFGVEAPQFDPAKLEEVKRALAEHFPLVVTAELPPEELEGVSTYHYAFRLDEARLAALQLRLAAITGEEITEAEARANAKEVAEATKEMKGEVWVGKKDLLLRKLSLQGPYRVAEGNGVPATEGRTTLELVLGAFDQPVSVTAPMGAKSFQSILEGFFGGSLNFGEGGPGGDVRPAPATLPTTLPAPR